MNELELDPRAIQRAIRELEHVDLDTVGIDDLEALLVPLFKGYKTAAPRFDPPVYIYRGRKCATKPTRLSELSYPPSYLVVAVGRANNTGESVFYGGTAKSVALAELGARPGDMFALSRWRTKGPIVLNHMGFSSEPEAFKDSGRRLDNIYEFVGSTRNQGHLNALVYDYLSFTFSRAVKGRELNHYKLTTAISRKLLNGTMIDGLLYPTIEMSGNADNIALKKEAADRLLQFVAVEYVLVKAVHDKRTHIDIIDSASSVDLIGTLQWSGRGLQWVLKEQGEQLKMVVEGGQWVAYDMLGRRVDPS